MTKDISLPLNFSGNKVKHNTYDYFLMFFLALQIFGVMGGSMQPIRIFVILCAPFTINFFLKNKKVTYRYQYEIFLFSVWIIYALITLFWAIIPLGSIKEILYLILNFFAFLTVIYLANKAINPQDSILKGWLLLFLLTLPIALIELWFDMHLAISAQEKGLVIRFGAQVLRRSFASVTYGNLNGYNTLLCYILPFLFCFSVRSLSKIYTVFIWLIILCLSYIIIMNGSRGAALSLMLGYSVFIFFYLKTKRILVILAILFLIAIYILLNYYDEVFTIIANRFAGLGLRDEGRSKLLISSWDAFVKSGMFGIGAGNFIPTMKSVYHLEYTAAHNLFLEVGVQYGLLILILFMGIILRLFFKQRGNQNKSSKFIIIASLVMFPLTSIIDSSYILSVGVWLFLASLYVIADRQYNIDLV